MLLPGAHILSFHLYNQIQTPYPDYKPTLGQRCLQAGVLVPDSIWNPPGRQLGLPDHQGVLNLRADRQLVVDKGGQNEDEMELMTHRQLVPGRPNSQQCWNVGM